VKGAHPLMPFDTYVAIRRTIDPFFYKIQLSLGRVLLSFLWFVGIYILFAKAQKPLMHYLGWLLLPFGTYSLTAYIIHGLIVLPVQVLLPISFNQFYNTAIAVIAVLAVWALMKVPLIRRIVPS